MHLYLDDLEATEELLKGSEALYFEVGDFKFDNVAEISQHYLNCWFDSIRIWSFDPLIDINLKGYDNTLFCRSTKDPIRVSGIFYNLDDLFKTRTKRLYFIGSRRGSRIISRMTTILNPLLTIWIFSINISSFFTNNTND
jgi:hypothetical protein